MSSRSSANSKLFRPLPFAELFDWSRGPWNPSMYSSRAQRRFLILWQVALDVSMLHLITLPGSKSSVIILPRHLNRCTLSITQLYVLLRSQECRDLRYILIVPENRSVITKKILYLLFWGWVTLGILEKRK